MSECTLGDRFWSKVDRSGGPNACWLWTAAKTSAGYGVYGISPKLFPAHRLSYQEMIGPIEPGLQIDHICRNRPCVNPRHLRPVTRSQNQQNQSVTGRVSASGIRGVHKHEGGWDVRIKLNGVRYRGGLFQDIAEAQEAAARLRNQLFTHNDADRVAPH